MTSAHTVTSEADEVFGFVGVTASQSAINKVFPIWAHLLGLDGVTLEPVDLSLDTEPSRYRAVVQDIWENPRHRGALVTSHKVRLLTAAADLFDELDYYARLCDEVSCISKRNDRLVGHAKDPITAGRSLDAFVPAGHFGRDGGHMLCIGAGGSGLAITIHLMTRPDPADRPARIVLVNRSAGRLETCRRILEQLPDLTTEVLYVSNSDPLRNDELMGQLPAGSLVINATGMGKDVPGSPVTDKAVFPQGGFAWEINYRGDLRFLHQARRQVVDRGLHAEDGWRYFIHGWSEVIAEAFQLEIDETTLKRLSEEAENVRSDTGLSTKPT